MTDTGSVTGPIAPQVSPGPDAAAWWHRARAFYPTLAPVDGR
jgi:hypothetical protein